jgi:hypothetical protein
MHDACPIVSDAVSGQCLCVTMNMTERAVSSGKSHLFVCLAYVVHCGSRDVALSNNLNESCGRVTHMLNLSRYLNNPNVTEASVK